MPIISPRRGGGRYEPVADINITPFVDVMLVLLIVFMITAPMLAAGMLVDLPKAKSARPLDPREPVIITIAKDRKLYVGRDEVSHAALAAAVRAKLGDDQNRQIYVRGDRDVIYGDIVAVMDQLALNGLVKMALVANASSATAVPSPEPEATAR
jgi:biopolymer transport protein ExbD/biopolymer transport protein TolR